MHSLKRLLHQEGYNILTASNGIEGLKKLDAEPVSLVISDQRMPQMSGVDFLRQVKEKSPETIRILLTGYADIKAAIGAINQGEVYRFITKPWNEEEVKYTIHQALDKYNTTLELVEALKSASLDTVRVLSEAVELKDPYTRGHCERVAQYALGIAKRLNLPEEETKYLKYASYLHDCGKIGIENQVLNKASKLTDREWDSIKRHTEMGERIVKQVRLLRKLAPLIRSHHEHYDGSGYPDGLAKDQIPIGARIIAVADAYDAMTSDRPYRKALSTEKAIRILSEEKGRQFDPLVVKHFLEFLREEKSDIRKSSLTGPYHLGLGQGKSTVYQGEIWKG